MGKTGKKGEQNEQGKFIFLLTDFRNFNFLFS